MTEAFRQRGSGLAEPGGGLSRRESASLPRMGQAIGSLLPLAVGVALSPVPIMVVIAMLFSPRAGSNGPVYVLGWIVAVGGVAGIALAASDVAGVGSEGPPTDGASWLRLGLGVLLLIGASRQWQKRTPPGAEASLPKWMAGIDAFTAPKAFGLAMLLGLKPKNLILSFAAGTTIAQANLSGGEQWGALAVFVVLASGALAIPVLYRAFGGARAQRTMDGWKLWMQHNNAAVMTVVFLAFGAVLSGQAIQALSA